MVISSRFAQVIGLVDDKLEKDKKVVSDFKTFILAVVVVVHKTSPIKEVLVLLSKPYHLPMGVKLAVPG